MDFPRNLFIEQAKLEGHSETYLKDTLNYIDLLQARKLPVIFSRHHLAILLDIDINKLKSIISNRENLYTYYLISKRTGGYRRVIAPRKILKDIQTWIKVNILDILEIDQHATGFVRGKSILNNAKAHEASEVILNLDLQSFFESISERRVYGIFKSFGYHPNLALDLARLCTTEISLKKFSKLQPYVKDEFQELLENDDARLPQGAPTSPVISNIICRRLDLRLSKLANKHNCNYSRYADDITFSGAELNIPKYSLVDRIIQSEDFKVNLKKGGFFKRGERQMVTGLLINGTVRVPKKFKKEIYRHLYFCKKYGVSSHFEKLNIQKGYRKEWIVGKIFFLNSIEPQEAAKMLQLVNAIDWEI